ncbi:MAG: VOC family protein [Anaerolineae bacterium]|nr:VOC family protein [Anaerolineae bacterium]
MNQITHLTYLVRDYDEAIQYFLNTLQFELVEDTRLDETKRWVLVRPRGGTTSLLLAQAASPEQAAAIGNQSGGRVFLFLHSDDFWRDYNLMRSLKVEFMEDPREEVYGTVAVFKDLYGNKWDLLQPK